MKQAKKAEKRFKFILNPYADVRFTRCPQCEGKTRLRKLPLVIHIEPKTLVALNKTCRYCPYCDLLIAHRNELEALLNAMFSQTAPELVGNDFLVLGTEDRADWKRGTQEPVSPPEVLARMHPFKEVLRLERSGGWGPRE